jgi:outer membrane protein assembly factor BamB
MEVFVHKGKTYVAVAGDRSVTLFDDKGGLVRELTTDDDVKVVHYWKERGWLVAGCHDFKVIPFDPAGGERPWVFESGEMAPLYHDTGQSGWYCRPPSGPAINNGIYALSSGVFLNGESQLFVGTVCTVEIVGSDGTLVHSAPTRAGMVTAIARMDRGDGHVELMPARQFGSFGMDRIYNTDPPERVMRTVGAFNPRQGASTCQKTIGGGYVFLEAVDLDGDGKQEVVALANGLLNGLHIWDNEGQLLADAAFGDGWASPRPSYEKGLDPLNMRGLGLADLDGDGRKEICVATSRGFLIVLTDRCEKVWVRRLPSDPVCVEAVDAGAATPGGVLVGCGDGRLYRLDATGAFTGRAAVKGIPARMSRIGDDTVAIATTGGEVIAYRAGTP